MVETSFTTQSWRTAVRFDGSKPGAQSLFVQCFKQFDQCWNTTQVIVLLYTAYLLYAGNEITVPALPKEGMYLLYIVFVASILFKLIPLNWVLSRRPSAENEAAWNAWNALRISEHEKPSLSWFFCFNGESVLWNCREQFLFILDLHGFPTPLNKENLWFLHI